jgi:hypothetical protein
MVDVDANVIHVERGWDDIDGEIATKGRTAGERRSLRRCVNTSVPPDALWAPR